MRADVAEPGDDAGQILPIRLTEIVYSHERWHHGHVSQSDILAEQPRAAAAPDFQIHAFIGAAETRERSVHLLFRKAGLPHREHEFTAYRLALRHGRKGLPTHFLEARQEGEIERGHSHGRSWHFVYEMHERAHTCAGNRILRCETVTRRNFVEVFSDHIGI